MDELGADFRSLPDEYKGIIRLAEEQEGVTVAPLQLLVGGRSGAIVYLVSLITNETRRVEHAILKLDRRGKAGGSDEVTRHQTVTARSSAEFVREHIPSLVLDPVEQGEAIGIFYGIAGQSLLGYRPLSDYRQQRQLAAIFAATNRVVLSEWNAGAAFEQAVHPQGVLAKWLGFRLDPGAPLQQFLREACAVDPDIPGFLINGNVFPNPLVHARRKELWGGARSLDIASGFYHGDLNTNNILVKFSEDPDVLDGYYLIDFALFKEHMPLLYDLRYLEMSYLIQTLTQVSFERCVELLTLMAEAEALDPRRVPVELSGFGAVVAAARQAFGDWVQADHPSLRDDLWGQYWLAGVAAGLSYAHKHMLGPTERLVGLVYAAANLKRFTALFGIRTPAEGRQLYDPARFEQQSAALGPAPAGSSFWPTGDVTFLFTDIEGSTPLWESQPQEMRAALEIHNATVRAAVAAHDGHIFKTIGDAFHAAFSRPAQAVAAAVQAQKDLLAARWGPLGPLRVRMGLHFGHAELREGEYLGHSLNRAARIMSAGHGSQILLSDDLVERVGDGLPEGVTLRDMGRHRLKGMARLEHLYQVVAPGLPSDFPRLATSDPAANNLPASVTDFVGREGELSSLRELLSDAHHRLVTIVAPGGMGKTRLAIEAASGMVEDFPQGIYFVALDPLTAPDQVVHAVVEVLPISLVSSEDPRTRVVDYLHDKKALLVMDNFEHVLEGSTLVQDILAAAPRVQVLATSRVRLNLSAETVFNLKGLPVDGDTPEPTSALHLFADSARRAQPSFELDATASPAVTRICRLVDGMPLAIVLAAAWIDTLSVDEIAAEIEKGLDILETEKRDVPNRQRSVRAVIESSWSQVDLTAQDLLKRLSVYRGGFTRAAAQEAAGASLRSLSQLVDRALLRRDPDTGRYSIHELLRQYAEEQLSASSEMKAEAHQTHATYFASFMHARWADLRHEAQPGALKEIEADLDNIRIALTYWAERQDAGHLHEFYDPLWAYFEVRSSLIPAIQLFEAAAQKLHSESPEAACARAHLRARQAWFTGLIGRPEEGLRMAQESIAVLREHRQAMSGLTLQAVCLNATSLNKVEIISKATEEMMAWVEGDGDTFERCDVLEWRMYPLILEHRPAEAMQAGQESLEIGRRLENPFLLTWAEYLTGACLLMQGEPSSAKPYFLRGVEQAQSIGYMRLLQICYEPLASLALAENDVAQAQHYALRSMRISQECGQTRELLASLRDLASVYVAQGRLEAALQLLEVVLAHPTSEQNTLTRPQRLRDEAEKLRAQIEARLDPDLYQSAWQAGQGRQLGEVVSQILEAG